MAYEPRKPLLLNALLDGLTASIRRDDPSAAERYRGRLRLVTEQIAADDPVHDVLEKLLDISGLWVVAAAVDRDGTKQQMLELIERVIGLFK